MNLHDIKLKCKLEDKMFEFLRNPFSLKSGRYTLKPNKSVQTPYAWEKRASQWSDFQSGPKHKALVMMMKMLHYR